MTQQTQETTAAYMNRASVFAHMKRRAVEEIIKSRGGTEMSHVAVQRKAATFLGKFAEEMNVRAAEQGSSSICLSGSVSSRCAPSLRACSVSPTWRCWPPRPTKRKAAIQMKQADMDLTGAAIKTRLQTQPRTLKSIRKSYDD
ncbi:hypothetical protein [Caballeronia grimmiae]|uniref:hypothetical protein n=1 Tax=Caballeronia grimmiae TaxID=1071679 RepID=UPI001268EF89|nr:hypothetical protein [Caballeronia grimmiae]